MSFLIPTGTSQLSACKYLSGASMFDGSVLASMSMSGCVPGMQMKLCIKMLDNKSPRDLTSSHISPSAQAATLWTGRQVRQALTS